MSLLQVTHLMTQKSQPDFNCQLELSRCFSFPSLFLVFSELIESPLRCPWSIPAFPAMSSAAGLMSPCPA